MCVVGFFLRFHKYLLFTKFYIFLLFALCKANALALLKYMIRMLRIFKTLGSQRKRAHEQAVFFFKFKQKSLYFEM